MTLKNYIINSYLYNSKWEKKNNLLCIYYASTCWVFKKSKIYLFVDIFILLRGMICNKMLCYSFTQMSPSVY